MCPVSYAVAKHSNYAQSKELEKKFRILTLVLTSLLSTVCEIAWANASVLRHRLACSALANSSVIGTNCGVQGLGTNLLQERGRSDVYLSGST
jgi:hypothetical protein